MVLATRCPHCETVFRVQDAQLARSQGRVRCGHCHEVFDASQNLLGPAAGTESGEHEPPAAAPERQPQEPPAAASIPEVTPTHAAESEAGSGSTAAAPEPAPAEPQIETPVEASPRDPAPIEPPAQTTAEPVASARHAARETLHDGHRMNSVPYEAAPSEPREPTLTRSPEPLPEVRDEAMHEPPRQEVPHRGSTEPRTPLPNDEPRFAPHEPTVPGWEADPEPRFRNPPRAEPGASRTAAAEGFRMPSAAPADEGAHFAVTRETRANAPRYMLRGILGTLVCVALALLLLAQLAWWQRETVMVYWPGSQPLFARVCAQIGCLLSPPRDIDGLQVEA